LAAAFLHLFDARTQLVHQRGHALAVFPERLGIGLDLAVEDVHQRATSRSNRSCTRSSGSARPRASGTSPCRSARTTLCPARAPPSEAAWSMTVPALAPSARRACWDYT